MKMSRFEVVTLAHSLSDPTRLFLSVFEHMGKSGVQLIVHQVDLFPGVYPV